MFTPRHRYSSTFSPNFGGVFDTYLFAFNGKEKIDEINGSGNDLDFGARIYDARLGRWLSLDPLQAKYPNMSPYNYAINSPIMLGDPDGNYVEVKTTRYIMVDGQKVEISLFKSIFVKAEIIEREVIIHHAKLIDLTGKLDPQQKIDLAKQVEDDITERWSTKNSKYADNNGYVINKNNQKVKVTTTFSEHVEVVDKESDIIHDDHVFAIVNRFDRRISKGKAAGQTYLNGPIMYFSLFGLFDDPLNLFAHEAGHWGGLRDIKRANEDPVKHIMSHWHSRKEKVGPYSDEFNKFFKSGKTSGVRRRSMEGEGVDLKKSN